MGTLLLDVGGRDNLSGEVEPLTEVVKTLESKLDNPSSLSRLAIERSQTYLGGEGVVVVLPGELGLDIAAGVEGLEGLDHIEVLGVNVGMLGLEVLLGHEHTLCSGNQSATVVFRERGRLDRPMRQGTGGVVHIPRKRYSWIFLRSSLGISLKGC